MRCIEMTAGASSGLIDTERCLPTSSSCGTEMFRNAATATQIRMIGSEASRMARAMR